MYIVDKCAVCNEKAPFKCTACKLVHYCNADHQKKDWAKHKIICRPFKIECSNELGRYLVATRDIPAKSKIFVEPPLVIGPKWCLNEDEKHSKIFPCVGCFRPTLINENQCPRCFWPACKEDCAGLNDPQRHEVECVVLSLRSRPGKTSNLDTLTDYYRSDILLTLRCLLLQWRYPNRWKTIMKLESHDQQRFGTRYYNEAEERIVSYLVDKYWPIVDSLEKEFDQSIIASRDKKMIHRVCGIMEVNALLIGLNFGNNEEIGALYENACILEHSCLPNCYYTFDTEKQFKITMHAGRFIKAGEHLSIMYTDMLWGTAMRQEHLLTNKYFICKCERCSDPSEMGTNFSAMKCIGDIGKSCGGTLLPKNPIDITSDWLWYCDTCDVSISNEQIGIVLTNIEQEVDDLMTPSASNIDPASIGPEIYEALIDKLSNLLHENHFHLFALKHTLIQMYGHKPNYLLHELSDGVLHRKIQMCEKLLSILDHIDPNSMRLTLYMGIVLFELHLAILEENRRQTSDGEINQEVLQLAQKYLSRGKDVLSLNKDMQQGLKLLESFDLAEDKLKVLLKN